MATRDYIEVMKHEGSNYGLACVSYASLAGAQAATIKGIGDSLKYGNAKFALELATNMKKESSFKLKSGNKPSFAKLSGVDKSPMRKNGEEKTYGKDKLTAEETRDEAQDKIETNLSTARSRGDKDAERYNRIIARGVRGGKITKEENQFLLDFQKKKKLKKKAEKEAVKK